jgi:lipopolysaccharide/colanic/teichoic acid biosynthesis glycosyltransferase
VNELLHDFKKHPQRGYECALHLTSVGEVKNLPQLVRHHQIDVAVVAIDHRNHPELQKELFECIPLHVQFFDFVDFFEQHFQRIPLAVIDRAWFLENLNEPGKEFFSRLKRTVDIAVALALGLIGLIFTPFIVLALLIGSGRGIFFQQMRVGQFEKPFRIVKFRSYLREGDDASVTAVGRVLRATHLDEIPQLWNILKGEMSFIGPRPEKVDFVAEFKKKIPFYAERLLVRPGITGWAQLHEPRAKAEDALQKLQYDLFYIKHRSLLFDVEIILKTLRILLS